MQIFNLEPLDRYAQMSFGDASRLTHQHHLLFRRIQRHIGAVEQHVGRHEESRTVLRQSIKHYLSHLNSEENIPLHFRMQVMHVFQEKCVACFDSEYIQLALESYLTAINLIPLNQVKHYIDVLHLCTAAMKIALYDLQKKRVAYQKMNQNTIRLVHRILQRIFPVSAYLSVYHEEELIKLGECVCWFELLRSVDLFSKNLELQQNIIDALHGSIQDIDVYFYEEGETLLCNTSEYGSYLIVRPNEPTDPLKLKPNVHDLDQCDQDMIVLKASKFLNKICEQASDMYHAQQAGCIHIRDALFHTERDSVRCVVDSQVLVIPALQALEQVHHNAMPKFSEENIKTSASHQAWNLANYTRKGACLVRKTQQFGLDKRKLNSLIGLHWKDQNNKNQIQLGFICWQKCNSRHERMGVEFFDIDYQLVQATLNHQPLIVIQEKQRPQMLWIPSNCIKVHDNIYLYTEKGASFFTIDKILIRGRNYNHCEVSPSHRYQENRIKM